MRLNQHRCGYRTEEGGEGSRCNIFSANRGVPSTVITGPHFLFLCLWKIGQILLLMPGGLSETCGQEMDGKKLLQITTKKAETMEVKLRGHYSALLFALLENFQSHS